MQLTSATYSLSSFQLCTRRKCQRQFLEIEQKHRQAEINKKIINLSSQGMINLLNLQVNGLYVNSYFVILCFFLSSRISDLSILLITINNFF